eukprot:GEMP01001862.1.p1 GENE.GEMP01001862.1~~GEMP01001862.1.p1  ORF type:complete len:1077 (+),score=173.18 GEMP01001862.1:160-3390(+)
MDDAKEKMQSTMLPPQARNFLRGTLVSNRVIESRRAKQRVFDFVIRDEAVAQNCGEFTNQVLFDPVDDDWQPWVCSCFSTSFHAYQWFMFLISAMLCILKPIRWSGFLKVLNLLENQDDVCWVLDVTFLLALLFRCRYSVLIKQWELFHPLYIVQLHVFTFQFWCGVASIVAAFIMLSPAYVEKFKNGFALSKTKSPPETVQTVQIVLGCVEELKLLFVGHCFGAETSGRGAELIQLILVGFLLLHFLACLWFAIVQSYPTLDMHIQTAAATRYPSNGASGWVPEVGNETSVNLYFFAFREVMMMMLGDGRPAYSDAELIFSIIVGFIGLVCCSSLLVAYVIQYLRQANLLADDQQEHLTVSRQALKSMDVPFQLVERIMSFQHFALQSYNHHYNAVLFDNISAPLVLELRLVLYHDLLVNAPFLREASANVVKKLVMNMKDTLYQPGDFIVRKNEPADEMFFIVRGVCDVLPVLDKAPIRAFFAGDYFGEIAILQHTQGAKICRRTAWVRAAAHTNLCTLKKSEFEDTFQLFPEEKTALIERLRIILPDPKSNTGKANPDGNLIYPTYIRDDNGLYVAVLPGEEPPPSFIEGSPGCDSEKSSDVQAPTKHWRRTCQSRTPIVLKTQRSGITQPKENILQASRTLGSLDKASSKVTYVLHSIGVNRRSNNSKANDGSERSGPSKSVDVLKHQRPTRSIFDVFKRKSGRITGDVLPIFKVETPCENDARGSPASPVNDAAPINESVVSRQRSISPRSSTGTHADIIIRRNSTIKMYSFDSSTRLKGQIAVPSPQSRPSLALKASNLFWKSVGKTHSDSDSAARLSMESGGFIDDDGDDSSCSSTSIGRSDARVSSYMRPFAKEASHTSLGNIEEGHSFRFQSSLCGDENENNGDDSHDKKEDARPAVEQTDSCGTSLSLLDVTPTGSLAIDSQASPSKGAKPSESMLSVNRASSVASSKRHSVSDISSVKRNSTDDVASTNLDEVSQYLDALHQKYSSPKHGMRPEQIRFPSESVNVPARHSANSLHEGTGRHSDNPESMADVYAVITEFVTAQHQSQQVLRGLQEAVRALSAHLAS